MVWSLPSQRAHTFYYLTLEEIEVGKAKARLPTAAPGGNIIIDSGTALTYSETSVYKEFASAAGSADASFPDMTFRFAGADILLKPLNSFIPISDGVVCLAMSPMDNFSIFGNIAQQNFEVGYDLAGKKVSLLQLIAPELKYIRSLEVRGVYGWGATWTS
ncbi:hypothetical protein ACLOJK_041788 [Asimina triloba]